MSLSISYLNCAIENCNFVYRNPGRQYCSTHYMRLKRYGDFSYRKIAQGENRKKHPLYATYCGMKNRCYSLSASHYEDYGGRGIAVSDLWLGVSGFWKFVEDMGDRPEGASLDRIDNEKGYYKENCRWATRKQQANNRRRRKYWKKPVEAVEA